MIAVSIYVGAPEGETVAAVLEDNAVTELLLWPGDSLEVESKALELISDKNPMTTIIFVPSGAGLLAKLQAVGIFVQGYNPNEQTKRRDKSGKLIFFNRRTLAWWLLRERLDPKSSNPITLPQSDALRLDIITVRWKIAQRGGKVQLETADDAYRRTGRLLQYGEVVASLMLVEEDIGLVYHIVECSMCGNKSSLMGFEGKRICRFCGAELKEEDINDDLEVNPWLKKLDPSTPNPWMSVYAPEKVKNDVN